MKYWGRIFFLYDDQQTGELQIVKGQPLENHVGNCYRLLKHFDSKYFQESSSTKARLMEAVRLHDEGKQATFRILQKDDGTFSYSFSGHRFHVPGHDPYIDALIRSHHDFSVERINRERAKFGAETDERKYFADDLYLLCMADQLEAELAVKRIEGDHKIVSRTFMEFVIEKLEDHIFTVIPWLFEPDELTLTFSLCIPLHTSFTGLSANDVQELFEKRNDFEEEELKIILRRM